jgi:hypothetical protein|tara:strand:+ start:5522 stop:6037 length:516 start_codon:yes stop_codon:yes gene_type:complete
MKDGKFQVDDLVVQTGSSDVMRVLGADYTVSDSISYGTIHCAIGDDNNSDYFLASCLSICPDVMVHDDPLIPQLVQNSLDDDAIHEEVCVLFARCLDSMRRAGIDETIQLKVETEQYGSSSNNGESDITFSVRIKYEDTIESDNLFKSARLAMIRHAENKELKPKQIQHYR